MGLKQRLQDDLKGALRAHDERRKLVIRMALAEITNAEIEQGDLDDSGVGAVLQKQAKRRRDTIAELKEVDRPDLLAEEQAELSILEEYLPQLLSRDEIVEEARAVIAEIGATGMAQMGAVMGQLMSKLKGRADGNVVNQVVRELLSG